jgi:ABC-2 type transport system permease protein
MMRSTQLARVAAIARRDFQTESTYRLRYATRLFEVLVTGVVIYNLSKLIVGSTEIARYGGHYFDFAMVGLAVMSTARLGLGAFNQNLLREQSLGTLEIVLSTPTPIAVLLGGSFVFPMLLTSIDLVLYVGGIVAFGHGIHATGAMYAVPLLILTLGSFCAFGIASASLLVLIRRGDPLTAPLSMLTSIAGGALFPVATLPLALRVVAHAVPAYYGIHGLREALLVGAGWRVVGGDLVVLLVLDALLLPLSVKVFARSLAIARRAGTLADY